MKKKLISIIMIAAVLITMIAPTSIFADSDAIKVILDGKQIQFDVDPEIKEDRTMVPMRAIFEALGYEIEWNSENRSVRAVKDDVEINMHIDFYTFWKNGQPMRTDVAPYINNGRTLVPLRVLSEASGCSVDWKDAVRTVFIASPPKNPLPVATPSSATKPTDISDKKPAAESTPTPIPKDLALDVNELQIAENKDYQFKTTVKAYLADERLVWRSSDENVATIDSKGYLEAVDDGECIIMVKAGSVTDTCKVKVTKVVKNPDIKFIGFNTTTFMKADKNYLTVTIHNNGDLPLIVNEEGTFKYKYGSKYYEQKVKSKDKMIIRSHSYDTVTFTKTEDEPVEIKGGKTGDNDFLDNLVFTIEYDGQKKTVTKYKKVIESDGSQPRDFSIN